MLYNKNNLAVAKIASKGTSRPELSGVFFTKDKTVATDSFKLVEMSVSKEFKVEDYPEADKKKAMRGMKPFIVNAEYLKKIKLEDKLSIPVMKNMAVSHIDDNKVEVLTFNKDMMGSPTWLPRISGEYPDYTKVMPTKEAIAEVELNADFIIEVCEILGKLNSLKSVKIKFYGKNEPILIEAKNENQSGRGLIMPLRG